MHRREFLAGAAAVVIHGVARAEAARLTAAEIESLLAGNTILGTWRGDPYRQYFNPGGRTIYAPRNSRPSEGRWRVDPETDSYESRWEQSGWSTYGIVRDLGGLFWVSESAPPQPFEVLPGDQLDWPE